MLLQEELCGEGEGGLQTFRNASGMSMDVNLVLLLPGSPCSLRLWYRSWVGVQQSPCRSGCEKPLKEHLIYGSHRVQLETLDFWSRVISYFL